MIIYREDTGTRLCWVGCAVGCLHKCVQKSFYTTRGTGLKLSAFELAIAFDAKSNSNDVRPFVYTF